MLFLANMLSKMKQGTALGSRIAEVHNGSSLFTGDAGQGESNIRRWILENDWLEAIVALPLNMFYNTGIATYVWVLTNRKPEHRRGRVQLIDATGWSRPLRKNLGKKNCELSAEDVQRICDTFLAFEETEQSKLFPNEAFGYWKVTVERPLRLAGIDPERAYKAAETKKLKESHERAEDAPPVIRKVHKRGTQADPLRGLVPTTFGGKAAVVDRVRAGHRPPGYRAGAAPGRGRDRGLSGARGTPPRPGRLVRAGHREDRLRDQLHAVLLQAPAAPDAGGDPGGHPGG
jgi:type I restriction enzyme M protein